MRLSAALSRLRPSPTVALSARAAAMKAEGRDVIALSAGEPDFDTPAHIRAAAAAAVEAGATRYTPPGGLPALKDAIAEKFRHENGLDFAREEIIVSPGGKQALFSALAATLDPGDEVIAPAPYWVSYPDIVQFFGATPVIVPCGAETGFKLTPGALADAVTERTRWVILNSPSNPAGAGYTRDELAALGAALPPHVAALCDDIYEHIAYPPFRFATLLEVAPGLRDRCLIVNGVSKAYAMTGWRIGYAAGPAGLIRAMTSFQSQSATCAAAPSQHAAIAALTGPQDYLAEALAAFQRRRDLVLDALNAADGLSCPTPDGAFYAFPSCAGCLGKTSAGGRRIGTDSDFCEALLEEQGVAAAPGAAFGLSPHFRISYAESDAVLAEACARITRFCARLA